LSASAKCSEREGPAWATTEPSAVTIAVASNVFRKLIVAFEGARIFLLDQFAKRVGQSVAGQVAGKKLDELSFGIHDVDE
jgi:hypothetical protein